MEHQKAKPSKVNLTPSFVANVRPTATRKLFWDHGGKNSERGLVLASNPTGRNAYYYYFRKNDRPRWYRISADDEISLADVRTEVMALRLRMRREPEYDPQEERAALKNGNTFEDLCCIYMERHAVPHLKSWKQSKAKIDGYLLPRFAKRLATSITRNDARQMFFEITDAGSAITANQAIAQLGSVYSWGIKNGFVDVPANPAHGAVDLNPTNKRTRNLHDNPGEFPKFWDAFVQLPSLYSHALRLLLLTGQRGDEVLHMRWSDVEFVDGGAWWDMQGEEDDTKGKPAWCGTKSKNDHAVWLSVPSMEIINELDPGEGNRHGYVLCNARGNRLSKNTLREHMVKISKGFGLTTKKERVTPHDLRRTWATTCAEIGFIKEQRRRCMNHAEGGISGVYDLHHFKPEMQKIQEAVGSRIMELTGRKQPDNVIPIGQSR